MQYALPMATPNTAPNSAATSTSNTAPTSTSNTARDTKPTAAQATALLVIDVQNDVVANDWHRDAIVANIASAVAKARQSEVPVVWVRHSSPTLIFGSEGWKIVPELVPNPGEPIIEKKYGDSFEDTNLGEVLDDLQARHLVVTGADTIACVISTCFGAFVRGFDVTLVTDGHTTADRTQLGLPASAQTIELINTIWKNRTAPGRTAKTTTAGELSFK